MVLTAVLRSTAPDTEPVNVFAVIAPTGWLTLPPPFVIRSTIVPVSPAPAPTAAAKVMPLPPLAKVIVVLSVVVTTGPATPSAQFPMWPGDVVGLEPVHSRILVYLVVQREIAIRREGTQGRDLTGSGAQINRAGGAAGQRSSYYIARGLCDRAGADGQAMRDRRRNGQ